MSTEQTVSDEPPREPNGGQLREALERLRGLVVEGLRHGFFDCSISCEVAKNGRRHLKIRAGKSYKFTIPEDELPH